MASDQQKSMSARRLTATDLWTVGQTAWGEARGEGEHGILAVCWVIRNRCEHHPRWRGMTPLVVCRAPMQFSCWNPGDPNRRKMEDVSLDDPVFAQSLIAAVETFAGLVASPVGDATHYYATGIPCPRWAEGQTLVATINHHTFFEGIA